MLGLLFPLISGLVQKKWQDDLNAAVPGLLGKPESARAGEEGPVQIPGSGLMADPANPQKQLEFASGLMAMPGGSRALQAFQPFLQNAIQGKQWQATHDTQISQYQQTEDRLTDQFQKQFGLQEQEARARAEQQLQAQSNWEREFALRQREYAQNQARAGAQLQMAREEHGWKKKEQEAKANLGILDPFGGAKAPTGYGVVMTPTGPSMMPAPGTQDFIKATEGEAQLVQAIGNIDKLVQTYAGKPEMIMGQKVRRGGTGSELWGPKAQEMDTTRGAILSSFATMIGNTGVLQEGERKAYEKMMASPRDPTTSTDTFVAGYDEVRRQLMEKLKAHQKSNPWLANQRAQAGGGQGGGQLPPGFKPIGGGGAPAGGGRGGGNAGVNFPMGASVPPAFMLTGGGR